MRAILALIVTVLSLALIASCDAGPGGDIGPDSLAAMGTAAAATQAALPARFAGLTQTAAVGTEAARSAAESTLGAMAARGTDSAVVIVATRAAADSAATRLALLDQATAGAIRSSVLGAEATATARALGVAAARAETAAAVDAWRAWAWAWVGVGAFMGLAMAVIWRVGLIIESTAAAVLALAKARAAEAEHTRARTALISGAVTLLENPEFTLRDNWRGQVLKFAELGEPARFNERVMAGAGISYEKSRLYAGILQSGGALVRTNAGSMYAAGWSLAALRESVELGKFDNLFPRQAGQLVTPPALS